jgi:hypothetical protein
MFLAGIPFFLFKSDICQERAGMTKLEKLYYSFKDLTHSTRHWNNGITSVIPACFWQGSRFSYLKAIPARSVQV